MPTEVCCGKMRELNLSEGERCNQLISSCLITEGGDNLLLNFQPPVSSVELLSTYFLIWCPRSSEHSLIMQEDAAQTPQHVSATRSQTVKCDFIKKKKKKKKRGGKKQTSHNLHHKGGLVQPCMHDSPSSITEASTAKCQNMCSTFLFI